MSTLDIASPSSCVLSVELIPFILVQLVLRDIYSAFHEVVTLMVPDLVRDRTQVYLKCGTVGGM